MAQRNPLISLSEEDFSDVVTEDVKDLAKTSYQKALRTPEIAPRWLDNLLGMKRSVECQFASAKAERSIKVSEYTENETLPITVSMRGDQPVIVHMTQLEFVAWQEKWRAGAIRFLSKIETKISEARKIRAEAYVDSQVSLLIQERDSYLKDLLSTRKAILVHKEAAQSEDEDESADADYALWALVDK